MALKIRVSTPLLPYVVKEVDYDDFERIDVGLKGEENSNHFYGNFGLCLMLNMLLVMRMDMFLGLICHKNIKVRKIKCWYWAT